MRFWPLAAVYVCDFGSVLALRVSVLSWFRSTVQSQKLFGLNLLFFSAAFGFASSLNCLFVVGPSARCF